MAFIKPDKPAEEQRFKPMTRKKNKIVPLIIFVVDRKLTTLLLTTPVKINKLVMVFAFCSCSHDYFVMPVTRPRQYC